MLVLILLLRKGIWNYLLQNPKKKENVLKNCLLFTMGSNKVSPNIIDKTTELYKQISTQTYKHKQWVIVIQTQQSFQLWSILMSVKMIDIFSYKTATRAEAMQRWIQFMFVLKQLLNAWLTFWNMNLKETQQLRECVFTLFGTNDNIRNN